MDTDIFVKNVLKRPNCDINEKFVCKKVKVEEEESGKFID